MSSAKLSSDIAELVSRAVSGEEINTRSEGETLAARYPGLGMSGELIGKAITRAAGMMGVSLDREEPRAPSAFDFGFGEDDAAQPHANGRGDDAGGEDASALDEALGELRLGEPDHLIDEPAEPIRVGADVAAAGGDEDVSGPDDASSPIPAVARGVLGRPVAAMRRAFFRSG